MLHVRGSLHVSWWPLHVSVGALHVNRGPLHVSMGSLHVTRGPLHVSWRSVHPSWGPLHVAHAIVVGHVPMCPWWGPHHPPLHRTLGAHQVPLRWHHGPLRWGSLRISWTHSSRGWAHHATRGPLHPSGSHTMGPLGAHVSWGAGMSLDTLGPLQVRWPHHALRGPLVRLGSRGWAHLSRAHKCRLHASRAHWGAHGVGHLLRRHVWRTALLTRRHGAPGTAGAREGGHRALSLWGAHVAIRVHLVHSVHLHLLQREKTIRVRKQT